MTGGRCQRRRKTMAGGRGIPEANCGSPNLKREFTEKPLYSLEFTTMPPACRVELDLYTQTRKALVSSGVSHLLSRQSDSRKRHKKLHSSSAHKSSTARRSRVYKFWAENEEYFRELSAEDVERLERVSSLGCSSSERCFLVPSLNNDESLCNRYGMINAMLSRACDDILNLENGVELNPSVKNEQEEDGPCSMDIVEDGDDEVERRELEIIEESNAEERLNSEKVIASFSAVEWLLGSRNKIYLASVCHYCSYGDMGDLLNKLIKCCSCAMVVHQMCYGVQEDVDSSWLCSWCKWTNIVDF